jgi:hypothetical protein
VRRMLRVGDAGRGVRVADMLLLVSGGETFIVSQGLDVGRGGAAWGAQIMGPETKVAIPAHDASRFA